MLFFVFIGCFGAEFCCVGGSCSLGVGAPCCTWKAPFFVGVLPERDCCFFCVVNKQSSGLVKTHVFIDTPPLATVLLLVRLVITKSLPR